MAWTWVIPLVVFTVLVMAYLGRAAAARYGLLMGVAVGLVTLGIVAVDVVAAITGGGDGIIPGAVLFLVGWIMVCVISMRADIRWFRATRAQR